MKLIITLPIILVLALLYVISKNADVDYLEEIKEYEFKLPQLATIGFFIMEKLHYQFSADYDRKIRMRLGELYGHRYKDIFFEVHNAQKVALIYAVVFFFVFIAIISDVEPGFFLLMPLAAGSVYYWMDKELDKKIKNKKSNMLIDLPDFINNITLLINAGLNFNTAVEKVVRDRGAKRPLYKELNNLISETKAGVPITHAFEDFANKCRTPEITRFVSTVLQNLNRGSADLVYVLRILAQESWERRKDIAKKQGEEASAKLVLPMMLIFVAIIIIVMAPAVLTMSGN